MVKRAGVMLGALAMLLSAASVRAADKQSIVLASTTSVENSGLLAHILPIFTKETGIEVRVLAQGTGQALATAARGDADLVLVHDPEAEEQVHRRGPRHRPAADRLERFHHRRPPLGPGACCRRP